MRIVIGAILLILLLASAGPTAAATVSFDGTTWLLRDSEGAPIAAIKSDRSNSLRRINVWLDPAHRFQWAKTSGEGYRAGTSVAREYHDLMVTSLGDRAATKIGWRNPFRIDDFIVPVVQFEGCDCPDGRGFVDVRADAKGGYLIVVTTILKGHSK